MYGFSKIYNTNMNVFTIIGLLLRPPSLRKIQNTHNPTSNCFRFFKSYIAYKLCTISYFVLTNDIEIVRWQTLLFSDASCCPKITVEVTQK